MLELDFLEKITSRLHEVESELADPGLAAVPGKLREKMAEHARLKQVIDVGAAYKKLIEEKQGTSLMLEDEKDEEMRALAQADLDRIEEELPGVERELMVALLPPDPDSGRNVIIEIRAGTGGDEAALFAGDLYRMYNRFVEYKKWKTGIINASPSNLGGYKEITFSVEGSDAFQTLRYESGGHRVQRIPVTETSGRIHTSAATVAVLPEAEAIDDIEIKPEELRIDIFRSSGPGGQSVNTTDSAVRLTHLETGIVVQSQDERSQHRNKEKAMRVLRARLLDRLRSEESSRLADQRRSLIGSGDRSQRIRTYNFPQNRLTDHRLGLTLYSLDRVMEGELDELLTSLYEHDMGEQLKQEMADRVSG